MNIKRIFKVFSIIVYSFIFIGSSQIILAQADQAQWEWGSKSDARIGSGIGPRGNVPVQVSDLTDMSAVAGGVFHSLGLKNDGTVLAWGWNYYGQLGNGTDGPFNSNIQVPVHVLNLADVTAVAGGYWHSLALRNDGTVWAWGFNGDGELGNGTNAGSNVPVQVMNLTGVIAISGGYFHSLALKNDGTVWAWGWNAYGELGNGVNTHSNVPVQVSNLTDVTAVAGGYWHSLALRNDGTVWAWGYNEGGELGNGTNADSNVPVQVSNLTGVTAVAGGVYHSLALKNDGTVWAWGYNYYGQLGNGTNGHGANSNVPVQASNLTGVTAISGGYFHSLALKNDGTVWAWGENPNGNLGDGTNTVSNVPVHAHNLTDVISIAGCYWHSLVLKKDGMVWAWGVLPIPTQEP